jgi:hypothetical protein
MVRATRMDGTTWLSSGAPSKITILVKGQVLELTGRVP